MCGDRDIEAHYTLKETDLLGKRDLTKETKETYHMAKLTYHMAKETYHIAKETYHMAKET